MKLLFLSLLLLTSVSVSYGQTCDCAAEFRFAKSYIEQNYAGFSTKITPDKKAAYEKYSAKMLKKTKGIVKPAYCIYLVNEWLTYFKDGHVQTGANRTYPDKGALDLTEVLKQTEVIKPAEKELDRLKASTSIEGIYWSADSVYRVALIRSKNSFRDYAGVVLDTKNKGWRAGQVILELKDPQNHWIKGIEYFRDHTPKNVSFMHAKDALGGWQREGTKSAKAETVSPELVSSKLLSKRTFYIKISTFNQSNAKNIDSLFKASRQILNSTDNLIIDIRNNGGGSDFAYKPITPYLYTNVIKSSGQDALATDGNMKGWRALLDMKDIPADNKAWVTEKLKLMEAHKGEFVPLSEDSYNRMDSIKAYPKRVVVLIDKGCGSTAEEFLLDARQSKKVTLMGQSTAGVLDYANMRESSFPGIPYALRCASTRSTRVAAGKGIDNIGIIPDLKLREDQNWIEEAQHLLESK